MPRTREAEWSPAAALEALQHEGDDEMRLAIRRYLGGRQISDADGPEAIRRELGRLLSATPPRSRRGELATFLLDRPPEPPAWMDDDLVARGQKVFVDHGLEMATALFFTALPMAYAVEPAATVLWRLSDFAGNRNFVRRVAETGQLLIDVSALRGPDGFRPGGAAHGTCVGLRVLHGLVREVVTAQGSWPDEGEPLNQALLLSTLLDFTLTTWAALEKMGVSLTEDDMEAHLHLWSVVGYLMGIDHPDALPLDLDSAGELAVLMWDHNLVDNGEPATPEGRDLTAALVDGTRRFMPLGWGRAPQTLLHWLFRPVAAPDAGGTLAQQPWVLPTTMPDALAVPAPSPILLRLLDAWHELNCHVRDLPLVGRAVRWGTGRAGRLVIIGLADHHTPGRAPFQLPPELRRAWHLPARVPVVRTARRRARAAVRSVR
ncbi:MAG: oxygenase MpaB family protein [Actinomycetota bacterium]|nr:oxygenase MpaB family protein [Actinomycetota bacterium]